MFRHLFLVVVSLSWLDSEVKELLPMLFKVDAAQTMTLPSSEDLNRHRRSQRALFTRTSTRWGRWELVNWEPRRSITYDWAIQHGLESRRKISKSVQCFSNRSWRLTRPFAWHTLTISQNQEKKEATLAHFHTVWTVMTFILRPCPNEWFKFLPSYS